MKAPGFGYFRAASLGDVFDALDAHGGDAKILAGGQSLVPALNMRLLEPRLLVDINRLDELGAIEERGGGMRIGALARHAAVGRSPLVARLAPLIAQAMPHVAHPAIRTRGTFGGSLAQADPAAELPACAVALDAVLQLTSRRGTRGVAASDFFRGLYETALAADEIITAVDIPAPMPQARFALLEIARRQGDYAIAGIAARARVEGAAIRDARFVFFGVGGKPVRATRAAEAMIGGDAADRVALAQEALAEDLDPMADLQADVATKRHLARVLIARAVQALTLPPGQGAA